MRRDTPLWKRVRTTKASRLYYRFALGFFVLFVSSFMILAHQANAAQTVPYKVNYQGRLTNAAGSSMADGQYNMTFRLYSVLNGGAATWTETRETTNRITVTNGQFAVQLGAVSALTPAMFTSQPLYLEVELPTPASATCSTASCGVYTEGAMTPRQALASSPYAMNSDTLDGIDAPSFARRDADNTFTGLQLFKNTSNAVGSFGVQNVAGSNILTVNTTNQRVGIGDITAGGGPIAALEVKSASGETLPALIVNNNGSGTIAQFQNAGTDIFSLASTGGTLSATSTTAFTIQKAAGSDVLLKADTSNNRLTVGNATGLDTATTLLVLDSAASDPTTGVSNGSMYYNTTTNKFRCRQNSSFVDCIGSGGVTTKNITLVPEYTGAVLTGDGTNNSVNVSSTSISGLVVGQGYKHNFYQWDTTSATAQDYGIVLNYQLPSDFSSFVSGSFDIWTYASSLTSTDVTFMVKSNTDALCYSSAVSVKPTSAVTWQKKLPGDPGNGCTFAANDIITMIITPTVIQPSTNKVNIGELHFAYQ